VKSILQIMYKSKKPAVRLKAARQIVRLAREAIEIEGFAAALADAESMIKAAQGRNPSTGIGLIARGAGHGAKLPRREEQAIVALLAHRSVAEAARSIGITPATLRLWMQGPAFKARYAEAVCEVYGATMRLVQQHLGDAAVVIRNISLDVEVPEQTRLKAAIYRVDALTTRPLPIWSRAFPEWSPVMQTRASRNCHRRSSAAISIGDCTRSNAACRKPAGRGRQKNHPGSRNRWQSGGYFGGGAGWPATLAGASGGI